ncbi:hypothetical protein FGB62_107g119 [Gracilaria domingensis]|nr:hypothetical protein FGB62_107g119 [Gracilaria domingensis]
MCAPLRVRMADVQQAAASGSGSGSEPQPQPQPQPAAEAPPRAEAELPPPPEPELAPEPATTSAADILKSLREDSAADAASATPDDKPRSMLGVYRDVDGRSNVWAVEPQEQEDTRPQLSKIALLAAAAAFIIAALLILPLLPLTNPDQL